MRKHLQFALMASPVIATFLSFTTPQVCAQAVSGKTAPITASTDDDGRKVYVNDAIPAAPHRTLVPTFVSSGLVYWSPTAHRWKPVPSANVRAARSAAAEVSQSQQASSFVRGKPFTQQEIEAAINQAAARHNVDPSLVRALTTLLHPQTATELLKQERRVVPRRVGPSVRQLARKARRSQGRQSDDEEDGAAVTPVREDDDASQERAS